MRPTFSGDVRRAPAARIRGTRVRTPDFCAPVGARTVTAGLTQFGKGS